MPDYLQPVFPDPDGYVALALLLVYLIFVSLVKERQQFLLFSLVVAFVLNSMPVIMDPPPSGCLPWCDYPDNFGFMAPSVSMVLWMINYPVQVVIDFGRSWVNSFT